MNFDRYLAAQRKGVNVISVVIVSFIAFMWAATLMNWAFACGCASHRLAHDDVKGALRLIARAARNHELTPAQVTFKGSALLLAGRYEEAEAVWREVVDRFDCDLSPNVRYAFLYARARLHALSGNAAMCARDERDASNVRCNRLIKERLLPGPELIEANDR